MKFQKNAFGCAWRASWLMGALVALPSWAVEPFALKDIRVEGLQRIEPGTVFASLPFRIGDTFTDDNCNVAMTSMHIPEPVINLMIKPKDNKAQLNMAKALNRFTREDPTFRCYVDA